MIRNGLWIAVTLLLVLAAGVYAVRHLPHEPLPASAQATETIPTRSGEMSVTRAMTTTGIAATTAMDASAASLVGKASGSLRFFVPTGMGGANATVELSPTASVGVWLPSQKRLRVLLLDQAPDYVDAVRAVDALGNSEVDVRGSARAMLELTFIPTAQAYSADEVDSIRLIVMDGEGHSAATDVSSSLRWTGGLAAPEVSTAPAQIEMQAAGSDPVSPIAGQSQSWTFATSLPVPTRP